MLPRWAAIVVLFLGARVIAPPGQAIPESVSWIGVLSLVLEIAAVAALAVGLPHNPARPHRRSSIAMPAVAAGAGFFLLDLVASGDLSYAQVTIPRPDSVGVYANGVTQLSPAPSPICSAGSTDSGAHPAVCAASCAAHAIGPPG